MLTRRSVSCAVVDGWVAVLVCGVQAAGRGVAAGVVAMSSAIPGLPGSGRPSDEGNDAGGAALSAARRSW